MGVNVKYRKNSPPVPFRPALSRWVEQLQSQGRYTFTRGEVETKTDRSFVAAQSALRRLKKQDRIVSPRRGFYVVVPPEYRTAGSPPASWFIDDLMRFLKQPYYVALLSAAAIHGAAHEQPMIFQIMTNKPIRKMRAGRVVIRSSMNLQIDQMPVIDVQTETGSMCVATPETTAFDLVRYPAGAGYLSNTATVLAELAERMDANALADVASLVRTPDVQRLGYLLEAVGEQRLTEPLADWLRTRRPRVVPLRPGVPAETVPDRRWHVLPNEKLELDL
jgi:predicted transcriptional regulator of viral defense system